MNNAQTNALLEHLQDSDADFLKQLFRRARIAERFEYGPMHITVFGFGRTRKHRREQEFYAKLNQVFYRMREAGVERALDGASLFVLYDWRVSEALAETDRSYLPRTRDKLRDYDALYEVYDDTVYIIARRGFDVCTLIHELGHRFYFQCMSASARAVWEASLSGEVGLDEKEAYEAFADIFKLYVIGAAKDIGPEFACGRIGALDPPWLQRLFKRVLEMVHVRVNPYGDPQKPRRFRRSSLRTHPRDLEGLRVRTALVRSEDYLQGPTITADDDVARLVKTALADEPDEGFYVLMLDGKHRVTGIYEAAHGTQTTVTTLPSSALRAAVLGNAHAVILVHNHPTTISEPSENDITLTKRFQEAGKVLGIVILDHVVVGAHDHTSLAERGLM